jgi:4-amino-4-deoxy-L-arabinose transferase-like glycosyltransferase
MSLTRLHTGEPLIRRRYNDRVTERFGPVGVIPRASLRAALPFYLLVAGAFAFLTITRTAQRGMFLDGVTYAAISRNLAAGKGTFWDPFYTATLYPHFHEHPPLGFGLQAMFFAAFGDHLFVERLYPVLAGILTAVLIVSLWQSTIRQPAYAWVPLVFWLVPPSMTWAIVNNLLDVTQALFTTLSVLAFVWSLSGTRFWWLWSLLAGASIVAGVLTKGPTGLYPLAAPVIAYVVIGEHRSATARSGLMILAAVGAAASVMVATPAARTALDLYVRDQLLASISGERGGARVTALADYLGRGVLLRMGGVAALAWLYARIATPRGAELRRPDRWTTFFLLLAAAASLPVAVSQRLSGHYFLPSIPMYALGFAGLSAGALQSVIESPRARRLAAVFGALLFAGTLAVPLAGLSLEARDVAWIQEYREIAPALPRGETVGTCPSTGGEWSLHAYMQRFFEISLDADPKSLSRHRLYLELTDRPCYVPPECGTRAAETKRFVLRRCEALR